MSPIAIRVIAFAAVYGCALLGLRLSAALPHPHLGAETKNVVKLAMGLVATMTALILGFLVASARDSYDRQKRGMLQMTAKVAFLDRILALYGAPAREARTALRGAVEEALTRMWPETKSQRPQLDPSRATGETLYHAIQNLIPQEENQRLLKSQASQIVLELGQTRWLLFEQSGTAVSGPLLTVVIAWLALIL